MYATAVTSAVTTSHIESEPIKLLKRIGSTTYKVSIRFSDKATETLEDKVLRLTLREVQNAS